MVKKYSQLYLDARRYLMESEGPQRAGMLARQILCHVSGKTQAQLISDYELYASEEMEQELYGLLDRVRAGEPLAYILGPLLALQHI